MSKHNEYLIEMDVAKPVTQTAELIRKHIQAFIDARVTPEGRSFEIANNARVLHRTTYQDILSLGNWDLPGIGEQVIFAISADIVAQILGNLE